MENKYGLTYKYVVKFDDGTVRDLKNLRETETCYFGEQKSTYLLIWLNDLIEREGITAKPVEIFESLEVFESDENIPLIIGL